VLNLSQKLQLRIRCCGFAPGAAEIFGPIPAGELNTIARTGHRAAWALSWLAGLPYGQLADPDLITALILDRWSTSSDFLTLGEIRAAIACSSENPCDTCREH
jgi:hypothetical protein